MRVLLLDKEKITKITLPEEVDGVFLMPYLPVGTKNERDLCIEARENKWILKSNGSINVMDNESIVSEIVLEDNTHLKVNLVGRSDILDLYCLPTYDKVPCRISVNTEQITIGRNSQCSISYDVDTILDTHAGIYRQQGIWYIAKPEGAENCTIYLNDYAIQNRHVLKVGDIVFINGLKIVWMQNFIQINNPFNKVMINPRFMSVYLGEDIDNTLFDPVSEEDAGYELYKQEDYFYHTPNLKEFISTKEIKIDDPPTSEIPNDHGMLTATTSLTMLASSFVSGFNVINNIINKASLRAILPAAVMFVAMFTGTLVMPRIVNAYNKKTRLKREKYRIEKYSAYLDSKEEEIKREIERQAAILNENNARVDVCVNALAGDNDGIWTREIKDDDFLEVRLGVGDRNAEIDVVAAEEHFTLDDDELYSRIYSIVNGSHKLTNVPITYSLCNHRFSAIVCNCSYRNQYIQSLIAQIAIYHSAADLKMVFLTSPDRLYDLSFAKYFPHCFSGDKTTRFYSENTDEMRVLSSYLEKIFVDRVEAAKQQKEEVAEGTVLEEKAIQKSYRKYDTYYLIVTDDFMNAKNLPIVDKLFGADDNYGFSFLILDTSMRKLPNKCKAFVNVIENEGCFMEKTINSQLYFKPEVDFNIDMRAIGKRLLNIPISETDVESMLPNSLTFLNMYGVSKIEQLNILNRWKSSDPTFSLSTPIGVHTSGEIFYLDLHEKKHGPHGLIAGSTGSGKSEFIITFILSMCVNYHPDEVQFILIDYKGGGLTGAFENRDLGKVVPHIAGTITNLDSSAINRSLVTINSELKRRQRMFNDSKTVTGESTIDIYKYQKYYREGIVKEPISHLFIVSDEFAELKAQHPDFINELVSAARIGRSLGVHLILATQKPTGVVNEQIWSNSKFKICLKVATKGDSMEMLKRPEAASIKETGRFYLQIGYDEYFDIGQSGWSGAKYIPTDRIIKKNDDSINFINNVGTVIKSSNNIVKKETTEELGDQLTNITKVLMDIADKENYVIRKLWLDNIAEFIYLDNLRMKYNYSPKPFVLDPVIGEFDDPAGQRQDVLKLDITKNGNTLIFGANGNGQENLLSTIIYSTAIDHTPEEVNFYIIDLGAETLKIFNKLPHVGDVCTIDNAEKITNLFVMLDSELDRRKELFSDYNGEYTYYIEKAQEKLPYIVCVINNYDTFVESFSKMNDMLSAFYRECSKYGISFIITCSTQTTIRSKIADYFLNKMCLKMARDEDYRNILNAKKGLLPENFKGRGIVKLTKDCYEFQSAYICEVDSINDQIKAVAAEMNQKYTEKAKRVPVLPDVVTLDLVDNELNGLEHVPIGFDVNTKEVYSYNFAKEKVNIVAANDFDEMVPFIYPLSTELSMIDSFKVKVLDFTKQLDYLKIGGEIINTDLNLVVLDMADELEKNQPILYMLVGLGNSGNILKPEINNFFKQILSKIGNYQNHFIILDSYENLRHLMLETWYTEVVNKNNGIWIGDGVGTQTAITFKGLSPDARRIQFSDMAFISAKECCLIRKMVTIEEDEE